jgi:hypothetical protein
MTINRYILLGSLALVTVMGGVALGAWLLEPEALPPQPIAFNHKLHLERAQGIVCQDCHQFVTTQTYAGLPSKFLCFDCHDPYGDESDVDADVNQPRFADLMVFSMADTDIPWHRVTTTREDVFFSHRMHVTVAGLDCRECHPRMPDRTRPPTRGPIQIAMDTCIDCHEENGASVDCVSCHR